jgi:hypothetical protein
VLAVKKCRRGSNFLNVQGLEAGEHNKPGAITYRMGQQMLGGTEVRRGCEGVKKQMVVGEGARNMDNTEPEVERQSHERSASFEKKNTKSTLMDSTLGN